MAHRAVQVVAGHLIFIWAGDKAENRINLFETKGAYGSGREQEMYNIQVDTTHDVVDVTLGGLMPLDEVAAYMAELKSTLGTHRLANYAMVIDVCECPIQSQEMINAMGVHMASMPKARALAIVTGSSLARMQIRRLFTQSYARIVATVEEGRAWVISGTEPNA